MTVRTVGVMGEIDIASTDDMFCSNKIVRNLGIFMQFK